MKNRIIGYLFLLFLFFSVGAAISMLYITFTTSELKQIITLHSVEILRQDLIIKIQNVEQDLLTVHTELGSKLDQIVDNVTHLDKAVDGCAGCHHSPIITEKIASVRRLVKGFENSLSYYITASANEDRIRDLRSESYSVASQLLGMTSEMALIANDRLQRRTEKAIDDVRNAQRILIVTLAIALLVGLWIAVHLTKKIIEPIRELIDVSRNITAGKLGYTTDYTDTTEFGELASSINDMSRSLKDSSDRALQHMRRLEGLYRVTLPFHSISGASEIYREVSNGVAVLINVEKCGLLVLDQDQEFFEHRGPGFGIDDKEGSTVRVSRDEVFELYSSHSGRPLMLNDMGAEKLPAGLIGSDVKNVRNMLLGWVRLQGDLIGVIRLVNKIDGDFDEESARLLGIISNNVSVALENSKLYEDLKAQMQELKETQEQLVQAAKLAAIGELASNVAHEINNPLTSIMGYAELIKEETSIENIMHDIAIIESESVRARDIVQQLLEFARRKPLEIRATDVNILLHETVVLMKVQLKDASIVIKENYAELPKILGDQNQLKQVFLNIISNAVHALNGSSKTISINTFKRDDSVLVEIEDNGHGIPRDVLPKIFEPFFTTKREKGTGLGLSITYRIIQSHRGKIEVKSEEGRGTKFIIALPAFQPEAFPLEGAHVV